MIPLRLQLRNFMCYGEAVPPLILDGVHVACLSGDNGHGKSALLDALTWALWGKARAKSDDELIRLGKTEMEVELEFAVEGRRHRVIRKRALKGKRGVTTLEFQTQGDSGYRPIGGESVHETQRKIVAALRMEYETFINSALLLQGRADEFTVKPPAERKRVLADVLGLVIYDTVEDQARQRARVAEQARRELVVSLDEIDKQLEHRPDYQARRDKLATELSTVAQEQEVQEAALRRARDAKHVLDQRRHRLDELVQRRDEERRHLAGLERQLAADLKELQSNEAVLARRAEVESSYQRSATLRARQEELARQAARLLDLSRRRAELEQAISVARAGIESELRVQSANLAMLRKKAGQRVTLGEDLGGLRHKLGMLGELEARRDGLREAMRAKVFEAQALKARNERLKEEMAQLKQKVDLLVGDGVMCPVCGTALGAEGRQQLGETYRRQGVDLATEYRANTAQIKEVEMAVGAGQREVVALDAQLAERDRLQAQAGGLERALAEAEQAAVEAEKAEIVAGALRERMERRDFAVSEQSEVLVVAEEIATVDYDPAEHERLRREQAALAGIEEGWAKVQQAATAVELLREKVRQGEQLTVRQRDLQADLERESARLETEVAQGSRVLQDLAEAEERVEQLAKRGSELRVQMGGAEQLLRHCDYLLQQRTEKSAALQRASEEKAIYDELALAFGKKGIQAMIIEGVLPEIEDEANDLLARMTDNRMNVKLETQREAKSADGVIETLDIKISDELGYRQYELYSGGEAFRVNFALRIALSKLLARRAGARLQTLILDEGFGTQDAAGRDRLVEAINLVSEEFDRILVITHIQELKDAFPVRIDVVKTAAGSQVILNE